MSLTSMRKFGKKPRGFNIVEIAIVVSMIAIVSAIGIPALLGSIQRTGVDGASRRLADDLRLAQSNAITRGVQARLIALNQAGTTSLPNPPTCAATTSLTDASRANRYRIEVRPSPGAAWPALTDTTGTNANVLTSWSIISNDYRSVVVTTGNTIVFNSQGFPVCAGPIDIVLQGSAGTRTVRTSSIGKATIQ